MISPPKELRTPNARYDYTNKDYEAFRAMMIKALQEKIPEYTDTSQTDAGIVILEALARGLDILSFYQDVMLNEALFSTAKDRESVVKWSKGLGYVPKNKTPARYQQVFALNNVQNSDFVIYKGTKLRTPEKAASQSETFEVESDFIIPAGKLGNETDTNGDYIYCATIAHGTSITDDLLGSSTGQSDQSFKLSYRSVLIDTITLYVNEGSGFEVWTRVKNFLDSEGTDKHYIAEVNENDETTIIFGNDLSGKIPSVFDNGIYANYRVGGGEVGNLPAKTITELVDNIALVRETFNPYEPLEYGAAAETIDEIKINAPAYLRTLWRAVHIDDHSDLLLINFSNVQFAKAIRDEDDRNQANVWVYLRNNAPLKEDFLAELYEFFDERKMVGNSVKIFPAEFYTVNLECSLYVKGDYYIADVEKETEVFLQTLFALGNIDFDTQIPLAQIESLTLHAVKGLRSFRITSPQVDMIIPAPQEIVTLGTVTFSSIGGK